MKNALIVTRHESLVAYAMEIGLVDETAEVITHATADNVRGRDVIGVLPHSLSCLTNSFCEIPLSIPAELRGKELSIEQMRQYSGKPVIYKVQLVE